MAATMLAAPASPIAAAARPAARAARTTAGPSGRSLRRARPGPAAETTAAANPATTSARNHHGTIMTFARSATGLGCHGTTLTAGWRTRPATAALAAR